MLAIVHFVSHFKQYLLSRKFILRTDHAALTWLRKTPHPIGQNARWMEALEEYSFDIKHRPGEQHRNADSMSRHPCLNRPSCTACHPELLTTAPATDQLPAPVQEAVQEETPDTRHICHIQGVTDPVESDTSPITEVSNSETDNGASVGRDGAADSPIGWSREHLEAQQMRDPTTKYLIELKTKFQQKPPWKEVESRSTEVKSLWHQYDRLEVRHGLLMRKWTPIHGHTPTWQLVVPKSLRKELIHLVHTGPTGGHLGRCKTEDQLSRRGYWPGWQSDVAQEVKKCKPCAQYHRGNAPKQTPLQPFQSGEPFEVISIDITGKHPKSKKGNEYIITIVDIFSKWAEAIPVRNHTAEVVAKALMEKVVCKFGTPLRILSDQGREFESALFQELCKWLEIDKIRTSPYQPRTNGCCERFHRTLNSMLAKTISENQRDWDSHLEPVMMAYRASKHQSTGFSPNRLVLGRETRAPVDLILGTLCEEDQPEDVTKTYDEYVEEQKEIYQQAFQQARENLGTTAERRKQEYDIRVKEKQFEVGQWVWYFYPRRYVQKSPKWTKNYDGPFLIVKSIPPNDFVIQKSRRSTPITVHADKLKIYSGEAPDSWLRRDNSTSPLTMPAIPEEPEVVQEESESSEDIPEPDTCPQPEARPTDERPTSAASPVGELEVTGSQDKRKSTLKRQKDEAHLRMEQAIDELIRSKRSRREPAWMKQYEH